MIERYTVYYSFNKMVFFRNKYRTGCSKTFHNVDEARAFVKECAEHGCTVTDIRNYIGRRINL